MLNYEEVVRCANALEPLPASTIRLTRLVAGGDPQTNELLEIVTYDPVLSAKVLQFANSALYGAPREIGTVRQAVVRIGAVHLLGIAMGISVQPLLRSAAALPYEGDSADLWGHSLRTALAADVLREGSSTGPAVSELTFTAAIIHDVGKLVLEQMVGPELLEEIGRAMSHGLRSFEAESEVLSFNHAEISGVIAKHWQMPTALIQALVQHHTPTAIEGAIEQAIFLGDAIAHDLEGHPLHIEADLETLNKVRRDLHVSTERYAEIREATSGRLETVRASFQ